VLASARGSLSPLFRRMLTLRMRGEGARRQGAMMAINSLGMPPAISLSGWFSRTSLR
jgi:hypothetical protein